MSDFAVPQSPSIEALLDLAASVDFLIRSRHQRQAAVAADHLARLLLFHYRELQTARPEMSTEAADVVARRVIIALVEAKSLAASARAGRAPHITRLRSLIQELHHAEVVTAGS
jgi:hypothetical protein